MFEPHQLDIEARFDSVAKAGSLLGSAAIIVREPLIRCG